MSLQRCNGARLLARLLNVFMGNTLGIVGSAKRNHLNSRRTVAGEQDRRCLVVCIGAILSGPKERSQGSTRRDSTSLSPEKDPEQVGQAGSPATTEVTFSEAGGVTVAAVLHLVSAELVLTRGLDADRFEAAARKKLHEFTSPTANRDANDAGLTFVQHLVEQVLVQIRAQAELKKRLGSGEHHTDIAQPRPPVAKLSN